MELSFLIKSYQFDLIEKSLLLCMKYAISHGHVFFSFCQEPRDKSFFQSKKAWDEFLKSSTILSPQSYVTITILLKEFGLNETTY